MSNLVDVTTTEDTQRVFIPNMGVSFNELTDEEKFTVYQCALYMRNVCEKKLQKQIDIVNQIRKILCPTCSDDEDYYDNEENEE